MVKTAGCWGFALAALVLAGCQAQTQGQVSTSSLVPDSIRFVFQKQKDPVALKASADALKAEMETAMGVKLDVQIPTSYAASVQALVSGQADVAYLSSLPYLLADAEKPLEILVVELREGKPLYDSLFVVPVESELKSLDRLAGSRIAFTSPTSASGYVFPYGHLREKGLVKNDPKDLFGEVLFAGGYDLALQAVLRGQADVATVSAYAFEGPSADKYLSAEERKKLRVLARVPGVPTHLIAARADLDPALKTKLRQTILKLSQEKPDLFSDVYGAAAFQAASDETHVDAARTAVEEAGLELKSLVN